MKKKATQEKFAKEIQRLRRRIAALETLESRHKQSEEALQKSALHYHSTLDSMGDAMHIIDKDLRFVMLNHAMRQWNKELGLKTNVVNQTVFEVFPFLPASVRDEYRQVFKTGETLLTEEHTMLAGKEFITETRKIPVFEGNSVARVITVLRNITEQKQNAERLRQQQERLQAIMDASPVAISWAMLEGGKLEYNNRMHRKLFGYTLDDIPTIAEWRRKAYPDPA